MYIKDDFLAANVSEFRLNSKAKNIIIGNWNKKFVNGIEVFDIQPIYNGNVIDSKANNKILKLVGTSVDAMKSQDWHGVDYAWFEFQYKNIASLAITKSGIYDRVFTKNVVGEDYIAHFQIATYPYVDKFTGEVRETVADARASIKTDFDNGVNLGKYTYLKTSAPSVEGVPIQNDSNWFIAFADTGQLIYNRDYTIGSTKTDIDVNGRRVFTTIVELRYSLKENAVTAIEADPLLTKIKDSTLDKFGNYVDGTLSDEFINLHIQLDDPGNLYVSVPRYAYSTTTGQLELDGYDRYLRVDKVNQMKLKTFTKLVKTAFHFEYRLKKADWWEKVVAVVLVVIIIVIAVVVCVGSGGTACYAAGQGAAYAIMTVASYIAITAAIISVILSLYAGMLDRMGYSGSAQNYGKYIKLFNSIAEIAGYVALFAGTINVVSNGFTKTVATSGGGTVTRAMTKPEIANFVIGQISSYSNMYMKYAMEQDAKKTQELQESVKEQEVMIAEYSAEDGVSATPKAMEAQQLVFEDYAFIDLNARMDAIPFNKTQGLIDNATQKYFS